MNYIRNKLDLLSKGHTLENIYSAIAENDNKIAAQYSEGEKIRRITYSQYDKYIKATAFKIRKCLGEEEEGQYVALKIDNCPEWIVLFWAILMAGYKPLLVDYRAPYILASRLLEEAGCSAVITSDDTFPEDAYVRISPTDIIDKDGEAPEGWQSRWMDKLALCTSGTTGTSRIYVYDGEAVANHLINADDIVKEYPTLMPEDDNVRILAFIPLHHVFGVFAVYFWYAFFGKTIVFLKNRGAATIMETSRMHRVTHIYAVPLLWNGIAAGVSKKLKGLPKKTQFKYERIFNLSLWIQKLSPEKARTILYNTLFQKLHEGLLGTDIRMLISGGGRIAPETLRLINALGLKLVSGYGMTEVGITSVDMTGKLSRRLNACLGHPFASYSYKITDGDSNGLGELCIKGSSMHMAVLKNGREMPPEVDSEGWLHCGDVAQLTDGLLYLKGRIKDVIINAEGENVYPDELEEYFTDIGPVEQQCILGHEKDDGYENIALVLYLGEKEMSKAQISKIAGRVYEINQSLPLYKKVKEAYISKELLPTANMKIKRGAVKKLLATNTEEFIPMDISGVSEAHMESEAATGRIEPMGKEPPMDSIELTAIKDRLRKEFSAALDISQNEIKDSSSFTEDLGVDSLMSIELLSRVEEFYNIQIPDSQYSRCGSLKDLSLLVLELAGGDSSLHETPEPVEQPEASSFKQTLQNNADVFIDEAHKRGFDIGNIRYNLTVPVKVNDPHSMQELCRELLNDGIYAYPADENGKELLLSINESMNREKIAHVLDKLKEL
jgi:acyl carrier protein